MKYGFIGTGNMGGTLAAAVAAKMGGETVILADLSIEKATALAQKTGAKVVTNDEAASTADLLFLGVKPQMMAGVLADLRPVLAARETPPVLVSMAAGISIEKLTEMLGLSCPVIRIMPNTPAAVGEGMILYATRDVTEAQAAAFTDALGGAGRLTAIEERLIDAASAVSGCGPAYAYLFLEGLADGGVECGLPRPLAMELAAQMLLGAAKMVRDTGIHPGALKDAVCSPGGTTIAGVHALEAGGFRGLAMDAVCAAYDRTAELMK